MGSPPNPAELPSLLGVTIRRAMIVGRISLLVGGVMVAFYAAGFGLGGQLFITIGAVVLPIFAVSGGLGGAMVFTNDRMKGVLEYLVAYGLSPRRILMNVMVASVVQVTVILAIGVTAGTTTYLLSGNSLTWRFLEVLAFYSFPMSYLTASLMTAVGVFWTSLSSPRSGMNSPLGVLPLIGVAPTTAVLLLALAVSAYAVQIALAAELVLAVLLLGLLARTDRLMPPERMLSSA